MIVKKVIQLCKKAKTLILYEGAGVQYISDGAGIYPLDGMPHFDEASICVAFDVSPQKINVLHELRLPESVDVRDTTEDEAEIAQSLMPVGDDIPFMTSAGVEFIDRAHLAPVYDGETRIFERHRAGGVYFVAKRGFILTAVIEPKALLDDEFVKRIESLANACRKTWELKNNE